MMKYNILKKFITVGFSTIFCICGISFANLQNSNTCLNSNVFAATTKTNAKKSITTNAAVYVRKSASTKSAKLGIIKKHVKVTVVSKTNTNWYKIKYNNGYGYIFGQYLNNTNSYKEKGITYPTKAKANHAAYIRKSANVKSGKLGVIKKNVIATVVAKTDYGWYKIKYNNGYGYVYSGYLDICK